MKKLLLHSCCAPCSSAVIERLIPDYNITVFFFNPNIVPYDEYQKRLSEQKRFLKEAHDNSIPLIEGEYSKSGYIPARCEECFLIRLEETARLAKEMRFDCFTTTLTVSSKKKAALINPIAAALSGRYRVEAILDDFKKKNGYNRSIELSKKYNLYRQNYCGCDGS
ncbi:MAG: epoxyqueuosine reductase QueH [Oscillospiraceae bacterium]|nr:epoxyqueuosine reductase QueH [Oscillospiraceae bacterium]